MRHRLALLVVIAVLAAAGWQLWQRAPARASLTTATATPTHASLPPASVLAVRPQAAPATAPATTMSPPTPSTRPPVSADLAQFRAHKDYAGLLARLRAQPDTAESLYLKAAIYARCAQQRTPPGVVNPPDTALSRAAKRDQFIASIAQSGKDPKPRIDAYDRLQQSPCDGLDFGTLDAVALQRQLQAAADAGDVRAQAWLVADTIEHRTPAEWGKPTSGDALSAADLDRLRAVMASGDPDVIRFLSGAVASTLEHGELRLDGESFDPMAMNSALLLLACDAGADCGADAPMLLQACALQGKCDVTNLYDYMYYYQHSPNSSQLLDAYRQSLARMVATGNFSGLTLSPVDPPQGFTYGFGSSRP